MLQVAREGLKPEKLYPKVTIHVTGRQGGVGA
jgi:hypothetical protein